MFKLIKDNTMHIVSKKHFSNTFLETLKHKEYCFFCTGSMPCTNDSIEMFIKMYIFKRLKQEKCLK